MKYKILLTGGAGFIGSHIADTYLENGHKVIIIDNFSKGQNKTPNAKFYNCDICNTEEIKKIFAQEKPDIVNHHAAQIDPRRASKAPLEDAQINILGSLNLMQEAAQYGVKKFIFASSAAVYGETEKFPTDENTPINPITPYGISKHSVEKYLKFFQKEYHLTHTILRYSNVYGPRQQNSSETGVISIFINQFLKNQALSINGEGLQTRDFLYVKDAAAANLLALEKGDNETLNISTGQETSINTLANLLSRQHHHLKAQNNDVQRSALNPQKAHKILNWQAKHTLPKGLNETLRHAQR